MSSLTPSLARFPRSRRGSLVLIIVAFLAMMALVPVGLQFVRISSRKTQSQIDMTAQASNVARAGLTEAIAWFRRQPTQPVRSFSNTTLYPYPDAAFYPRQSGTSVTDTIDETIGLVKEYQLTSSDKTWARYEVHRQSHTAYYPVNPRAVHDITDRRIEGYQAGEGLAWYIESIGYVYRRRNPSVAFNMAPNEIVGRARVASEIRRLSLTLPANCAVIINNRSRATFQNNGRAIGGTTGIGLGYYSGGAATVTGSGSQITGSASTYDIDGSGLSGSVSLQSVLGVTQNELKLMADMTVGSVSELTADYPSLAVIFINGNATFDSTRQLRGGGDFVRERKSHHGRHLQHAF